MVETGELSTALSEMLDGRRIVKAYGLEHQAIKRAEIRIDNRLYHLIRALKARSASAPAADFFGGLAMAAAILYAGYEGIAGRLELNQFASFVGAMLLAQGPVRNLSQLWTITTEGLGAAKRVFALMSLKAKDRELVGGTDGLRADVDGNVWASAGWGGEGFDGVHIFAPDGQRIGQIVLPETVSNICFGGPKRNRLFITASQSLYAVYVETQGAHIA